MRKTTELPEDATVEQAMKDEIAKNTVLFVVNGSGTEDAELANKASGLAGDDQDSRWVVWAKVPNSVKGAFGGLTSPNHNADDLADARGFTVSMTNRVCDVIERSEAPPDNARVFQAYMNAEAD